MKTSEKTALIMGALAKALPVLKNPAFDSKNPHFNSKFASLSAVRAAVVTGLNEYGVAVQQELVTNEVGVGCITRLIHQSGEWMETEPFCVPVDKGNAQAACAASTYARRYSLQAICGVVGDDDDDGNAASAVPPKAREKPSQTAQAGQKQNDDQNAPWLARIAACTTPESLAIVGKEAQEKGALTEVVKQAGVKKKKEMVDAALAGPLTAPPLPPLPEPPKATVQPDTAAALTEQGPLAPVVQPGTTLDEKTRKQMETAPWPEKLSREIVTKLMYRLDDATRKRLFESVKGDVTKVGYGLDRGGWEQLAARTVDAVRLAGIAI